MFAESSWSLAPDHLVEELHSGDVTLLGQVLLRLVVAAILGGLIGFERERKDKPAGLRTQILVGMGACLFVVAFQLDPRCTSDSLSRVIQGILTGIGFIGAGTIMKSGDRHRVEGLTTAASVWLTTAVGLAVGYGQMLLAALGALLALLVLTALQQAECWIQEQPTHERSAHER